MPLKLWVGLSVSSADVYEWNFETIRKSYECFPDSRPSLTTLTENLVQRKI